MICQDSWKREWKHRQTLCIFLQIHQVTLRTFRKLISGGLKHFKQSLCFFVCNYSACVKSKSRKRQLEELFCLWKCKIENDRETERSWNKPIVTFQWHLIPSPSSNTRRGGTRRSLRSVGGTREWQCGGVESPEGNCNEKCCKEERRERKKRKRRKYQSGNSTLNRKIPPLYIPVRTNKHPSHRPIVSKAKNKSNEPMKNGKNKLNGDWSDGKMIIPPPRRCWRILLCFVVIFVIKRDRKDGKQTILREFFSLWVAFGFLISGAVQQTRHQAARYLFQFLFWQLWGEHRWAPQSQKLNGFDSWMKSTNGYFYFFSVVFGERAWEEGDSQLFKFLAPFFKTNYHFGWDTEGMMSTLDRYSYLPRVSFIPLF